MTSSRKQENQRWIKYIKNLRSNRQLLKESLSHNGLPSDYLHHRNATTYHRRLLQTNDALGKFGNVEYEYDYDTGFSGILTKFGLKNQKRIEKLIDHFENKLAKYIIFSCLVITGTFLVFYFICWPITTFCWFNCCIQCQNWKDIVSRKPEGYTALSRMAKRSGIDMPNQQVIRKAIEKLDSGKNDSEDMEVKKNLNHAARLEISDEHNNSPDNSTVLLKDLD